MKQCYIVRLFGQVHGVGLRVSIREQASELNLAGWVKNNPDGTVSVLIQGEEENMKRFLSWLETGEYSSLIQQKQVEHQAPDSRIKTFEIRS